MLLVQYNYSCKHNKYQFDRTFIKCELVAYYSVHNVVCLNWESKPDCTYDCPTCY